MTGAGRGTDDWDTAVHRRPSAIQVYRLHDSHGMDACIERWPWMHPRTLYSMSRTGRKQLERRQKT